MKLKEILRWATILLCGGFGLYGLVGCLWGIVALPNADPFGALFLLAFTAFFAGLPLAISYLAFRRQYHHIAKIFAAIGAVVIFDALFTVPNRLGFYRFYDSHHIEMPWISILVLPFWLLFLFGPFYVSRWFFRLCLRWANRFIHNESPHERMAQPDP